MFHKYKTKSSAQRMFERYGNMHNRQIVKLGSRWIVAGQNNGEWHALGDHGWAFPLSPADVAKIQ